MAWDRASAPVSAATSEGWKREVRGQGKHIWGQAVLPDHILVLFPRSVMTATPVTSDPVPAVVGMHRWGQASLRSPSPHHIL